MRGAVALFVAASLVACSGGSASISPGMSGASTSHGGSRHTMYLNLGDTQPVLTGVALIPLTLSLSNGVGTLSAFGSTYCAAASGLNPCPNINFMASPPMWQNATPISFTMAATVLNAACDTPASPPSPAPGFTPACYVGAYEGGSGPYLIQGPVTGSAGSLSVPANVSTLNFNPQEAYNFFLVYVTAISSPPPPPTPTPVASPTVIGSQPPPATPPPTSTPAPTSKPSLTPSPCPSSTSDDDGGDHHRHRDVRRNGGGDDDGGDDDGGSCASPTPQPTPTCSGDDGGDGHHRHSDTRSAHERHHHHDGDCEDD